MSRMRIKVCGLRRAEDVRLAVDLGVDMLGFNCWPGSPRHVDVELLRELIAIVPRETEVVLVFVRAEPGHVTRVVATVGGASRTIAVQLHGDEDPSRFASVGAPVIQVLRVGDGEAPAIRSERVLVDVHAAAFGGTGRRVDPAVLERLIPALPAGWILAGGLDAENVGDAIRRWAPGGVDVASGVEREPGVKDREKLTAFVARVREADETNARRAMTNERPGYFGAYGGRFVPETLIPALDELADGFARARADATYPGELASLLRDFAGRPTPLMLAESLTAKAGGARIYLKREDLLHTGAHKLNNTLGQCLLAKRMGKTRVIAETGAGQHGVATAAACAKLGLRCEVFMGAVDVERQAPNVQRMRLLGATLHPVESGTRTLKDAMNEALRDWVSTVRTTFYCLGSVAGPHPYPTMVRDLQRVIGDEARRQVQEREGRLPDAVVACVGGGSNAMGLFTAFLADASVALWGVEAGGHGLATGRHGASLAKGRAAVLHGSRSSVLQDADGQIADAHSISAGLDYPGVGPELAALRDAGRLSLASATDAEALDAFAALCREEGILPALESAHALARAVDIARGCGPRGLVVVNLSGRGDKDLASAQRALDARASENPS